MEFNPTVLQKYSEGRNSFMEERARELSKTALKQAILLKHTWKEKIFYKIFDVKKKT